MAKKRQTLRQKHERKTVSSYTRLDAQPMFATTGASGSALTHE